MSAPSAAKGSSHSRRVDAHSQFHEAYQKLTKKDKRLKDAIDSMMERIEDDPLTGDPKTGALRGLRSTHVARHWVIVWELRPVIVSRAMLGELEEIWFYDCYHHRE
jgi:addiction module RelE/StbE family toxin